MTREEWLEARRNSIGASEVAAILGESPWASPLSVWYDKVHGNQDRDTDYLFYGREMERAIRGMYRRKTNRQVNELDPYLIEYHPDIRWLGVTLDAQVWRDGKPGALELKNVGGWNVNQREWSFSPPDYYLYQLHTQISCCDFDWGCLAGMFPGTQLEIYETLPRPEFLEAAFPVLEKFWQCVKDKTPPEPDGGKASASVLKKMYPNDSGEVIALNGDRWVDLINEYNEASAFIKSSDARKKEIAALLRAEMKEATQAVLNNGTMITSRLVERCGYSVNPTKYRTFSVKRSKQA